MDGQMLKFSYKIVFMPYKVVNVGLFVDYLP